MLIVLRVIRRLRTDLTLELPVLNLYGAGHARARVVGGEPWKPLAWLPRIGVRGVWKFPFCFFYKKKGTYIVLDVYTAVHRN